MIAICPNNKNHKRFITVAHVTEDWIVDEEGNFLEKYGYDQITVQGPMPENIWTCQECGSEAQVSY